MGKLKFISIVAISINLLGCSNSGERQSAQNNGVVIYQNSVNIDYGTDICSYSGEVIKTVRYGGKITMSDGTVHKFMSTECTAGFYHGIADKSAINKIEVVDFAHGQQFLLVEDLVFLRSSLRPSPNGLNLTAVDRSNEKMKTYIYDAYPGKYYNWEEVLEIVENEWNLSTTAMK
jgi:hypothetical protein